MDRVIIIGTGVFGLSTADHIHQKWPSAQLSIVSRPSTLAPSDDISKIVRVDYSNAERMTEAVAAQKQWNSDTKFSKYQRSIGRVVIYEQDDAATVQKINEVREELGLSRREPGDRTLMKDTFGTAAAPESLTYISAPDDSIVDWEPCISVARARAKDACVNSGGTFYESGVTRLVQDGNRITSLMLENGEAVEAGDAQIVLAVGPWFAQVLDASDIPLPPAGRIPMATGLFSYNVQLNEEQTKFFRGKPMVSHRGKGCVGKLTTQTLVDGVTHRELKPRHCTNRDGVTATQDPLIAKHPQFPNLICVAGGSYNRAKDLPTIGSTVVDVLSGRDVPDRYSWEPEREYSHRDHSHLVARGDFGAMETEAQDMMDPAAGNLFLGVI
ncbi:predicted protein [Chaetomium globosum CBS 148.51]|uniref:FAD dependent oxidoreductase domain-containing protein n=1 Tax=Chaetomium globosum (strain ATCC 6205 / CBS 148.51 / DSM 1962 / NBRC 6347 / NRRL 1970) TaxID=306901 RepID=Q2HGF0_CHAGB|nr:uncharacterized protein CHGG_00704 [Chaetomium globosum CBS 148.51]EAQ92469.1 predicted protein [Chaetomium globosum CBS 148.51]